MKLTLCDGVLLTSNFIVTIEYFGANTMKLNCQRWGVSHFRY